MVDFAAMNSPEELDKDTPEPTESDGSAEAPQQRSAMYVILPALTSVLVGTALGIGVFTFDYGKGTSY